MEDWAKEWFQTLETVADEIDKFFQDLERDLHETVEVLTQISEEVVEQVQNAVISELDRNFGDLLLPIITVWIEFDDTLIDEAEFLAHPGEPEPVKHPACVGCQHYHGQAYGGHVFVCAMHPYGWDGEQCPDWETGPWEDDGY